MTIKFNRQLNGFVVDKTIPSTHRKADICTRGDNYALPKGVVSREEVGITNSQFTIATFNNLNRDLWHLVVIFVSMKLNPGCTLGVYVVVQTEARVITSTPLAI
jgi:hypothetical protein